MVQLTSLGICMAQHEAIKTFALLKRLLVITMLFNVMHCSCKVAVNSFN